MIIMIIDRVLRPWGGPGTGRTKILFVEVGSSFNVQTI